MPIFLFPQSPGLSNCFKVSRTPRARSAPKDGKSQKFLLTIMISLLKCCIPLPKNIEDVNQSIRRFFTEIYCHRSFESALRRESPVALSQTGLHV